MQGLSIKIPFSKKSSKPQEGDMIAVYKNNKAKVMKSNEELQVGFYINGKIISRGDFTTNG